MIDSLLHFLPVAQQSHIGDQLRLTLGQTWQRFAVLTLHRPSNVDSVDKLGQLLNAVAAIANEVPVIFPVHPRTQQRLTETGLTKCHSHLSMIPPLGYLDFWLADRASFILTDSGGIQEETTALGVPCLTFERTPSGRLQFR
jgi:UDP-N-acetylglucosamine 2-epimerase (non-hydrolysing)